MSHTAEDLALRMTRRAEQRRLDCYDALLANDVFGVLAVADGEVLHCNDTAARLFGWPAHELAGAAAAALFASEDEFQAFASRAADPLAAGGSVALEWRCRRRDGTGLWARVVVKGIANGGAGSEAVWMIEDIGARKDADATLAAVRAELEDRIRAAQDELQWSNHQLVAELYERNEAEERVRRSALYDELTGLPNRRLLANRLDEALRSHHLAGDKLAVLLIDFDGFTAMNEALGRRMGDALLKQAAERLVASVRTSDLVARTGADEFAVVLGLLRHADDAEGVAAKLIEHLGQPYEIDAEEVALSVSVGASRFPVDGNTAEALLRNADAALRWTRERARGSVQFFEPRMSADMVRRLRVESGLRRALERGEFVVHYQPRYALDGHALVGAEALVRWNDPIHGLQEPGVFMAVAEQTGLIAPIGEFVLAQACRDAAGWPDGPRGALALSVNLSPREVRGRSLLPVVSQALADSGLDADRLQVDITEASLMRDPHGAQAALTELRALGVHLSLDDFGTGYSSLSMLRRFPIDTIKIDGSFVRAAADTASDAKIVAAIASLGRELGLRVIAEGVETVEQLEFARKVGCDEAQGYYLGRPMAPAAFVRRVADDTRQ